MNETLGHGRPEIDSNNGLEVVWKAQPNKKLEYSLVKVPIGTPVYMTYGRLKSGIDITLIPQDKDWWNFRGRVDYQTLTALLPAEKLLKEGKLYNSHPRISDFDADYLHYLGDIGSNDDSKFLVNFRVNEAKIRRFLRYSWMPEGIKFDGTFPYMSLDERRAPYKILPQRIPQNKDDLTLIVKTYQPDI